MNRMEVEGVVVGTVWIPKAKEGDISKGRGDERTETQKRFCFHYQKLRERYRSGLIYWRRTRVTQPEIMVFSERMTWYEIFVKNVN